MPKLGPILSALFASQTEEPKPSGTAAQICPSIPLVRPSPKDVLTPGTRDSVVRTNAGIETWCPENRLPDLPPATAKTAPASKQVAAVKG
jgi:hypothetical protein